MDVSPSCGNCGACQSLGYLISVFDKNTPELQVHASLCPGPFVCVTLLQSIMIAASAPIAILVCTWLMMSSKERMLLLTGRWGSAKEDDDVEKGASIMNQHMGIELPKDRENLL